MISPETIDQVMSSARIEDVVGDFVSLKRRGTNMIGLCPFHNEKTPSFNVSPAKGIFKCFGCGQAGNSVKFIMELEKLSYPETIRFLAKKYNINVIEDEQPEEIRQEIQERESMYLVNQWASDWFSEMLWKDEEGRAIALSYFKERGFTDETIQEFGLGYHPAGSGALGNAATRAGYKATYLVKTGLCIEKDEKLFDRFRGRVMFPIRNISGKVLGFGGRILGNDKKIAKYLNSPESEVYHKSNVLYGIFEARKSISSEDEALLVEGYTDVISMHQSGIHNVVASSGTSLTVEQIRLINRYTKNITILYDGDAAGIKASFRGLDMILEQGMNVKVVPLPEGEDPDSFAKGNSAIFLKEFIRKEAKDFISYKTDILQKEAAGDPIKTAGMIKEIIHSLSVIPDPILRSLFLKECSSKLDMEEQTLIFELNRQLKASQNKAYQQGPPPELPPMGNDGMPPFFPEDDEGSAQTLAPKRQAEAQEADIIRILLQYANHPVVFKETNDSGEREDHVYRVGDIILSELIQDELLPQEPIHLKIFNVFSAVTEENDFPSEAFFLHHTDAELSAAAIDLTSIRHTLSENWRDKHQIFITSEADLSKKMVMSAVYAYKLRRVQEMLAEINLRLQSNSGDEEMMADLEKFANLQQAKMELARQLSYVIL